MQAPRRRKSRGQSVKGVAGDDEAPGPGRPYLEKAAGTGGWEGTERLPSLAQRGLRQAYYLSAPPLTFHLLVLANASPPDTHAIS